MKKKHLITPIVTVSILLSACGSVSNSSTPKSSELSSEYSYYQDCIKPLCSVMGITHEEADEVFIILSSCGVDEKITYVFKNVSGNDTYYTVWYGSHSLKVYLKGSVVDKVLSSWGKKIYPVDSSEASTEFSPSETESVSESNAEVSLLQPADNKLEYDKLQQVFLAINFETKEDDILKLIKDNNLEYTVEEYNGSPKCNTYKLAYEEDVSLQKYADSGDYIKVSFNKDNGSLMFVEYFNNELFKTALLYNYGVYWNFSEREPNNEYSGYYYYKPGDTQGSITMKDYNGNSSETGYYNVNSAQDALRNILK
nr:MAG TPA: outer membrane protein assembly factor [Caudoviricetes sp.]